MTTRSVWAGRQSKVDTGADLEDTASVQDETVDSDRSHGGGGQVVAKCKRTESAAMDKEDGTKPSIAAAHGLDNAREDTGTNMRRGKKKTKTMVAAPQKERPHCAPRINVDGLTWLLHWIRHQVPPAGHDSNKIYDEDGEDQEPAKAMGTELEDEEDSAKEERNKGEVGLNLFAEGVKLLDSRGRVMSTPPPQYRMPSRSPSPTSNADEVPLTTNNSGYTSPLDDSEDNSPPLGPSSRKPSTWAARTTTQYHQRNASMVPRPTTGHKKKLEQELPRIHNSKKLKQVTSAKSWPSGEHAIKAERPESPALCDRRDGSDSHDGRPWKPCTELELTFNRNTPEIKLRRQRPEITAVLCQSFVLGAYQLVFGRYIDGDEDPAVIGAATSTVATPMVSGGLERIALEALIKAAESLGFDGEFNIAHRLEDGSADFYIQPLWSYTVHRLTLVRTTIKTAATSVVPEVLELSKNSKYRNLELLEGSNYIYPWSAKDAAYIKNELFKNPVIARIIRVAFFTHHQYNNIAFQYPHAFVPIDPTMTSEREIVLTMVAFAATAAEAVIYDHVNHVSKPADFGGQACDSTFRAHLTLLSELREKKPDCYHRLMREMHKTVVGTLAASSGGQLPSDIVAAVDWDSILS
ncbi:hypothetical protein B0H21DRAFT_822759 [Amylocystis lapponica]|nr:hypothetical protein B0H21DRAFT_822759 [Amylocystis lapponica]